MLCQLVCVDRRYQRMNCFNIRELQGILKRKFFTDLVNNSNNHKAMESTLVNMRHKNNNANILLYDQSLFYNFDLTNTSKSKNYSFLPGKIYTYGDNTQVNTRTINSVTIINNLLTQNSIIVFKNTSIQLFKDFISFISLPNVNIILFNNFNNFNYILTSLVNSITINNNKLHLNLIKP
jgi:hypothetical protein